MPKIPAKPEDEKKKPAAAAPAAPEKKPEVSTAPGNVNPADPAKQKPADVTQAPATTEASPNPADPKQDPAAAQAPQAQPEESPSGKPSAPAEAGAANPAAPEDLGTPMPGEPVPGVPVAPQIGPKAATGSNLVGDLFYGTAEKTVAVSAWHRQSQLRPYNPDDLVQKAGDYSIYEDMVNDDQINVCLQLKKDLVLAGGWDIECKEDELQPIKDDLDKALREDLSVGFEEMLEEMLTAYEFGFSLTEKIFQTREDGSLILKALKTRHPATWLIHTDEKGNIEKYEQRGQKETLNVDPKALIHYVNNRKFQNPYGTSDLRAAYNAWFVKRQIIRFYAIFQEKAAGPMPVAKYPNGTPQRAVDELHAAIKSFQAKTALTIPKEVELEWLEAKSNGEVYVKGINLFNMFIGRALLIPDLLGFQGGETSGGSYSLGKDQMMVLFKHVQKRRDTLERLVNTHIIRPIVVYNWGFVDKFPKWKLRPIKDEDLVELAKGWLEAVKGKAFTPTPEEINHFRRIMKFPEGEVVQPGIDPATGLPLPPPDPNADPNAPEGTTPPEGDGTPPKGGKPVAGKPPAPASGAAPAPGAKAPAAPAPAAAAPKKSFSKALYSDLPGEYQRKVDFTAAEAHFESGKNKIMAEAEPVVKKIFQDLFDQIERKGILKNQNAEKMDSLSLKNLKDLKLILKKNLRDAHTDGKRMGERELFKTNYRSPLPDDKFLEILESENFQYVGDWAYSVTKKVRQILLAAIKDGKPLSSVIDMLEADGMTEALTSLERYARTKLTEVTNRGRLEFFNESGVIAGYQYAAVLDDRTSAICEGLHGKFFKAGTEPVPPMHFNCRSLLIPITKYEEFTPDEKVGKTPIETFIEENKGDGFATK
jgi:SPP1 gp7 family putative phage head morphogenesis protein